MFRRFQRTLPIPRADPFAIDTGTAASPPTVQHHGREHGFCRPERAPDVIPELTAARRSTEALGK